MLKINDLRVDGYERVLHATSSTTGLDGYFAIHSTALGPALGGCRFWTYSNSNDALEDALRLSQGMTMKNSLAGLNLGGGKSVINLTGTTKTPEMLEEIGQVVESLCGSYFIAEDVGSTLDDMHVIRRKTEWVGTLNGSGDPSQATALGVLRAMEACLEYKERSFSEARVFIEGMGNVGFNLARFLVQKGARVFATDISSKAKARCLDYFGNRVTWIEPDAEFDPMNFYTVYAPCALGGAVNEHIFEHVNCEIICGSANNQLSHPLMGYMLMQKGVLYAPDYLANAGGVINCAAEFAEGGYNAFDVAMRLDQIGERCAEVIRRSEGMNQPTNYVADAMALSRINQIIVGELDD